MACTGNVPLVVAGILGMIQSLFGLALNILFLLILFNTNLFMAVPISDVNLKGLITRINDHSTLPAAETLFGYNHRAVLGVFLTIGPDLNYYNVAKGMSITSAVLSCLWLINSVAILACGSKSTAIMKSWMFTTILVTFLDLGFLIVIVVMIQPQFAIIIEFISKMYIDTTVTNGLILVLLVYNRFGIIGIFANIAVCLFVRRRIRELQNPNNFHESSMLSPVYPGRLLAAPQSYNYPMEGYENKGGSYYAYSTR